MHILFKYFAITICDFANYTTKKILSIYVCNSHNVVYINNQYYILYCDHGRRLIMHFRELIGTKRRKILFIVSPKICFFGGRKNLANWFFGGKVPNSHKHMNLENKLFLHSVF